MTKSFGKENITAHVPHLGFSPMGGACFFQPENPEGNAPLTDRVPAQEPDFADENEPDTCTVRRKDKSPDRSLSGVIFKWLTNC